MDIKIQRTATCRTCFSEFYSEQKETPMTGRSNPSNAERPKDQGKTRSAKPRVQDAEWKSADELLDEALRHTFPASDALSITQNVRGS
jgi:hypothetical protein